MKSRLAIAIVALAALAAVGLASRPVAPGGPTNERPRGLRTFGADLIWLQANMAWEQRDAARMEAMVRLAVALDPQPLYFWLNGARMLAYDAPDWSPDVADGTRPAALRREKLARRAIDFLQQARLRHPASAALWIERANIELNVFHDLGSAAESYRHASEEPDAPYFAARLHAEMLRRMGRQGEALAWLKEIYPKLPQTDEAAETDVVLARIRALERELGVPEEKRFARPESSD